MNRRFTRTVSATMLPVMLSACVSMPPPGTRLTDAQRADAQKSCINQYVVGGAVGGALFGMLISSKRDRRGVRGIPRRGCDRPGDRLTCRLPTCPPGNPPTWH